MNLGTEPRSCRSRTWWASSPSTSASTGEVRWDTSKPDGQPRRGVDRTRAAKEFGFRAGVDFDDGLQRTIDWYLANRTAAEARAV